MEDILSKPVCDQERWVSMTEDFLPAAKWRVKQQANKGQRSIENSLIGFALHEFISEMVGILPFPSYFNLHQDRGWS
jgi:hypothetical protein